MKILAHYVFAILLCSIGFFLIKDNLVNEEKKWHVNTMLGWIEYEFSHGSNEVDRVSLLIQKLAYLYANKIDALTFKGTAQKAICKLNFDKGLRNRLSEKTVYKKLNDYLNELWVDVEGEFELSKGNECVFKLDELLNNGLESK